MKLYKNKEDKMLEGVCAGLADELGVSHTLIRVLWLAATMAGGSGIVAYIIAALLMPERNDNDLTTG